MGGRRARLALIVPVACALLGAGDPAAGRSVVLIVVDTLRADHLGSQGFQGGISPNLDALAAESLRFDHCFAQAPWTKPSVATLFTSLEPERHGVTNHEGRFWSRDGESQRVGILPAEAATLAEAFEAAGHRTAAFVANPWLVAGLGFEQGFETYDDSAVGNATTAHALLPRVRAWLSEVGDAPFFLYLHFMDVHGPYDAPVSDVAAMADSPSLGPDRPLSAAERAAIPSYLAKGAFGESAEARRLRAWRARYAAGVHAFDRRVGPFLAALRRGGTLDRAWLVVTSDHGEELAEHGGWDHGHNLFDHQLHVPLLIRPPGRAPQGRTATDLVGLIDLMPTLLAAAGVAVPGTVSGRDFSPLLRGEEAPGREAVFAGATKERPGLRAVRTRQHKLVVDTATGERVLFDLERDPLERADASDASPGALGALRAHLDAHRAWLASSGGLDRATAPIGPADRERLRALGYAD